MTSKTLVPLVVALVVAMGPTAAAQSPQVEEALSQRLMAHALSVAVGIACPDCEMGGLQREMLTERVAHYSFRVRVGAGQYDVIEMHHVVTEASPWVPARTRDALFALPGGAASFDLTYLADAIAAAPGHRNLGTFLADNDVDVWGLSHSWALLPPGVTDFTFMDGWGLEHQLDNISIGLAIARRARSLEGNGDGRLILAGMSDGARDAYTYLDRETQVPPGLRRVKGFIPIDIHLKLERNDLRQRACDRASAQWQWIKSGSYGDDSGVVTRMAGFAAEHRPDAPSPVLAGLTNLQAALLIGTASYIFVTDNPTLHWVAGRFDSQGLPYGLQYTRTDFYLQLLQSFAPVIPRRLVMDYEDITCEATDVPFDDHLSEVTVPVFYVGARGGYGDYGVYSTTLLGSRDVTVHLASTWPAAYRMLDFGHADILYGDHAESLVWQPMLEWIRAHR